MNLWESELSLLYHAAPLTAMRKRRSIHCICRGGGTGRRNGFKTRRVYSHEGSTPSRGKDEIFIYKRVLTNKT